MAINRVKSKKYGYLYQVDLRYKDHLGMTKRHIKSGFKDMKSAKKYEKEYKDHIQLIATKAEESKRTLNDIYEEYMDMEGKNKYASATINYYNSTYYSYVKDNIGNKMIGSLKYKNTQKYFNEISKKQNIPTLKNIKKTLAVTFNYAMRVGYVKENPIPLIQLPRDNRDKIIVKTISDENLRIIIDDIQKVGRTSPYQKKEDAEFVGKSYAMAIIIGRYSGLRISEVLALKKEDFDLKNNQLSVQRKMEYIGKRKNEICLVERLKTKNSKSTIKISPYLTNQLKKWFEINPYDLVICSYDGTIISPDTLNMKIRNITKKHGIDFHFHMLRHTFATELMMAGVNPVVVKELLRHSDVNTTWSIYTHPSNEDQRNALNQLYELK